jgi:glycosyl hydrolase family 18 (putative chitinase)
MRITRRRMLALSAGALAAAAPASALAAGGTGMSVGSYPGWVHEDWPPESLDFSPWTHLFHFGMYPTETGEIDLADMIDPTYPDRAVAAAHGAGRRIALVIGGEGTGDGFTGATRPENRARFVENVVATMSEHGYDGVVIDWEEDVADEPFTALLADLRTAIGDAYLGVDVLSGLVAPALAASVHEHVDTVNLMSYWSDGDDELSAYRDAGVPAAKLVLGVGLSADYHDTTVERVRAKVDTVRRAGLAGAESWQLGDLSGPDDPRLEPLRELAGN